MAVILDHGSELTMPIVHHRRLRADDDLGAGEASRLQKGVRRLPERANGDCAVPDLSWLLLMNAHAYRPPSSCFTVEYTLDPTPIRIVRIGHFSDSGLEVYSNSGIFERPGS